MQIGEVGERTGLSLRTIRWYEEVGLAPPSARSQGGFRLYTESDVERLQLVKRMKPLELSLDEVRDLLEVLDALASDRPTGEERADLVRRLTAYRETAELRIERLRRQLDSAEGFAADLRVHEARHAEPRTADG